MVLQADKIFSRVLSYLMLRTIVRGVFHPPGAAQEPRNAEAHGVTELVSGPACGGSGRGGAQR